VRVERHLCIEHAADALIGVAERESADLIVVGSRGLGAGKRVFLGSVSSKMAHHAPCSVLIAGTR
jgi:nucleotide-binding universal stress UspA family protein